MPKLYRNDSRRRGRIKQPFFEWTLRQLLCLYKFFYWIFVSLYWIWCLYNRIYKNIRGIKDKTFVRTEVDVIDEDGNLVYDDKGNVLKEKQTKVETSPVILNEDESKIKAVMQYYITHGYSNGEIFYTDNDVMDMRLGLIRRGDTISIDGDLYSGCTKIEYMIEKYFPEMTAAEFRNLSVREIGDMLNKVEEMECKLNEARA